MSDNGTPTIEQRTAVTSNEIAVAGPTGSATKIYTSNFSIAKRRPSPSFVRPTTSSSNTIRTNYNSTSAAFTSFTHQQLLLDSIRYEEGNAEHESFWKRLQLLEQSYAQRTVVIRGVLYETKNRNIHTTTNATGSNYNEPKRIVLQKLKKYFIQNNLGRIEECYYIGEKDNEDRNSTNRRKGRRRGGKGRGPNQHNMERLLDAERREIERLRNIKMNSTSTMNGTTTISSDYRNNPLVQVRFFDENDCTNLLKTIRNNCGYLPICSSIGCIPVSDINNTCNTNTISYHRNSSQQKLNNARGGLVSRSRNAEYHQGIGVGQQHWYGEQDARLRQQNEEQRRSNNNIRNVCTRYPGDTSTNTMVIHIKKFSTKPTSIVDQIVHSTTIEIVPIGMSLGHYTSDDMQIQFEQSLLGKMSSNNTTSRSVLRQLPSEQQNDHGQWLEGKRVSLVPGTCKQSELNVKIDTTKRMIEMSIPRVSLSDITDFLTLRFKDIDGYIDLCRYENSTCNDNSKVTYSIIFSCKYPPRLYSNKPTFGLGYAFSSDELKEYTRDVVFGGIESTCFGQWTSIKLDLTHEHIEKLLLNQNLLPKLKQYGMMRLNVNDIRHARPIEIIHLSTSSFSSSNHRQTSKQEQQLVIQQLEQSFESKMLQLQQYNPYIGLTFRSIIDQKKFTWYHVMMDECSCNANTTSGCTTTMDGYDVGYGGDEQEQLHHMQQQQQQHHKIPHSARTQTTKTKKQTIFYFLQVYPAHAVLEVRMFVG